MNSPKLSQLAIAFLVTLATSANAADWVNLFNGNNLNGWKQINGTAKYEVHEGAIRGWTVEGSPNSFLCTVKDYGDWRSVFVGIPYITSELLRSIAVDSGVHLYFDGELASLHANSEIVSIHSRSDRATQGELRLPSPSKVTDAFTGETYSSEPVSSIQIELAPSETLVLLLEN